MTTKELFEKAVTDAEFAGKFQNVKTPEECYEVAKASGLTDSFEAFVEAAAKFKDAGEKLDAAEIDAVLGGGSDDTITTMTPVMSSNPICHMATAIG